MDLETYVALSLFQVEWLCKNCELPFDFSDSFFESSDISSVFESSDVSFSLESSEVSDDLRQIKSSRNLNLKF